MEIVILAGGSGRRFGGVKQFVPVSPDGATLLEVTVRDAAGAGCARAVIVTGPGMEEEVRSLFAARPVSGCRVTVVTQDPADLPLPLAIDRDRPWGTAHALWAVRKAVTGPFLLFNADDYYGPSAPVTLAAALAAEDRRPRFAMLGFPLGTTLSKAGTVSRAVCETGPGGLLKTMREYPAIDEAGRIAKGEDQGRLLPLDSPVSMNAWGLTPAVFPLLEEALKDFLANADLEHDECYLPAAIDAGIQAGAIEVLVVPAVDRWCGMTYREDRLRVAEMLAERADLADRAVLMQAARGFGLDDPQSPPTKIGTGLVHATWRLDTPQGPRLLQRLNAEVFPDPGAMAENAAAAAIRIDDALGRMGDKDPHHRLIYVNSPAGRPWLHDDAGGIWRCLVGVPHSRPGDPANPREVRAAAKALGRFPGLVSRGRGPELTQILPGFHNTPSRLQTFQEVAAKDPRRPLSTCRQECDRLKNLADLADRLATANLPVRPVHNDAKLDNVLVDDVTGEALCVIDLDTAMPGLAPHDFGDLVRSAVTGRPEDEPDLGRITIRKDVFRDLAKGYLEGAQEWMTPAERDRLVDGALVITYEQALRFMTDYLEGDVYYRTDHPEHNLMRARAQIRLLDQLLSAEDDLRKIVAESTPDI